MKESYSTDMEEDFYSRTDEKKIIRQRLRKILAGRQFDHAIDLACGKGDLIPVLTELSKNVTAVDILPEYAQIVKKRFPDVNNITAIPAHLSSSLVIAIF